MGKNKKSWKELIAYIPFICGQHMKGRLEQFFTAPGIYLLICYVTRIGDTQTDRISSHRKWRHQKFCRCLVPKRQTDARDLWGAPLRLVQAPGYTEGLVQPIRSWWRGTRGLRQDGELMSLHRRQNKMDLNLNKCNDYPHPRGYISGRARGEAYQLCDAYKARNSPRNYGRVAQYDWQLRSGANLHLWYWTFILPTPI